MCLLRYRRLFFLRSFFVYCVLDPSFNSCHFQSGPVNYIAWFILGESSTDNSTDITATRKCSRSIWSNRKIGGSPLGWRKRCRLISMPFEWCQPYQVGHIECEANFRWLNLSFFDQLTVKWISTNLIFSWQNLKNRSSICRMYSTMLANVLM